MNLRRSCGVHIAPGLGGSGVSSSPRDRRIFAIMPPYWRGDYCGKAIVKSRHADVVEEERPWGGPRCAWHGFLLASTDLVAFAESKAFGLCLSD